MNKIEELEHALKLAREDLWFLMNFAENLPEQYIWRAAGTAMSATKTLRDAVEFNPWRDKWIAEGLNAAAIRSSIAKDDQEGRYIPQPRCEDTWEQEIECLYEVPSIRCEKAKDHRGTHSFTHAFNWTSETCKQGKEVIINGYLHAGLDGLFGDTVTYEELIQRAYPGTKQKIFTVSFSGPSGSDGRRSGTLTPGQKVRLETGMIFNIYDTSNA